MDSPEGESPAPVKRNNPILRLLGVLGIVTGTTVGSAACGNEVTTPHERETQQNSQNLNNRNAADAAATATSKQAQEFKKQVDQVLGQNDKDLVNR